MDLHRPVTHGKYRVNRFYLSDEAFAVPFVGSSDPRDVLGRKQWDHLMVLPTDVLLRTTDNFGTMIEDMQQQSSAWLDALTFDETKWPFFHAAYLDVLEELDAAPFIAAHGWYRQATSGLRNALEVMTHACRYAVANDEAGFSAWRGGTLPEPLKFGNSVDIIGAKPRGRALDDTLGAPGLFGVRPDGVLRALYSDVCRYAHSQPGFTNGDIWQSNGPVFVPRAFTQFWLDFCDTSLACFAMLKLAFPAAKADGMWKEIAGNVGAAWHGLAPATVEALKLTE